MILAKVIVLLIIIFIYDVAPTVQGQTVNLEFYEKLMEAHKAQSPVKIMRDMLDEELGQVAASLTPTSTFLSYEAKGEIRQIGERLMSLKASGEVDMVIFLGRGHRELLDILVNDLKVFNSGSVIGVLPKSEFHSPSSLTLSLSTKLYYFTTQQDNSVDLMEAYAIRGLPINDTVGRWSKIEGLTIRTPNIWDRRTDFGGQTIRVTSKTYVGLSFLKYEGSNITGGGGYFIEPVYYLGKKLNFTPKFLGSVDGKWGGMDGNGTWNGMVGMLVKDQADIIAAGLARTWDRDSAVTFGITLLEGRFSLIAPATKVWAINMWAYLEIFSIPSWAMCGFMVIAVAIVFTILNAAYHIQGAGDSEPVNLINGMGLSMLMLLQLSYKVSVPNIATRILLFTAGLGFYLIFSYFAADLTARMTLGPKEALIRSFDDVLEEGYSVICTHSSSQHEILKISKPGTAMHKVYYETMHGNPDSFVKNSKIGREIILENEKTLMFSNQFRAMQDDALQLLDIQV